MLKLYTGKPGSFKTAKAVSDAMQYLKDGRAVYTNIDSFDYDGVQKLPESLAWQDTPAGSVIIYDEAQQFEFFQYKGREKLSTDERVKGLETHRHQGYDIILITQSPSFLHNHVLSLVGEHYHLHRAYGRSFADVFLWRYTATQPDSSAAKSKAEAHEKFKPDSKVFDKYKSTELDTHKLKIPTLYYKLGGAVIAVILIIVYTVFFSNNSFLSAKKIKSNYDSTKKGNVTTASNLPPAAGVQPSSAPVTSPAGAPMAPVSTAVDPESLRVAAVIESNHDCRAYNGLGNYVDIELSKCLDYARHPYKLQASTRPRNDQVTPSQYQTASYTPSPANTTPAPVTAATVQSANGTAL